MPTIPVRQRWSDRWLAPLVLAVLLQLLPGTAAVADPTVYGTGIDPKTETLSVYALLKEPERYVDQVVRVEGRVGDVCPMAGCWIDILPADASTEGAARAPRVRFKVKDGEIVFPLDATGKHVVAEGVVTRLEFSREEAVAYEQHLAEELDEPFDPASVKGPMTLYQIRGTGAVVD